MGSKDLIQAPEERCEDRALRRQLAARRLLDALEEYVDASLLAAPAREEWMDQDRSPLGRRRHLELVRRGVLADVREGRPLREATDGLRGAYWDVVAGSFIATARSLGLLGAFAVAGVRAYQITAVLDETTPICQFRDGKVFGVDDTLARWGRAETSDDPYAIKSELPWGRSSAEGMRVPRGEERVAIGSNTSNRELAEPGLSMPPLHGLCRSSIFSLG